MKRSADKLMVKIRLNNYVFSNKWEGDNIGINHGFKRRTL